MAKTQYSLSTDAAAKVIHNENKLILLNATILFDTILTIFFLDNDREFQLASEFLFATYVPQLVQVISTLFVETS